MWVGVLVSLVVALVMGAMTLRMRGVFFALATVAVSLAMVQIARHYVDLTGGANGLALKFIGNSLWAMQSRTPAPFLYAGLVFVIVYYWITRLDSRQPARPRNAGGARRRESRPLPRACRCSAPRCSGFMVSAAMTALAGAPLHAVLHGDRSGSRIRAVRRRSSCSFRR